MRTMAKVILAVFLARHTEAGPMQWHEKAFPREKCMNRFIVERGFCEGERVDSLCSQSVTGSLCSFAGDSRKALPLLKKLCVHGFILVFARV